MVDSVQRGGRELQKPALSFIVFKLFGKVGYKWTESIKLQLPTLGGKGSFNGRNWRRLRGSLVLWSLVSG